MKVILKLLFFLCVSHLSICQNGKLISKKAIELNQTPIWAKISKNDTLIADYKYLLNLNFFFISYSSDGNLVRGIVVEPKKEGKYPVVIFNRGGNRSFSPLTVATMITFTAKLADEGYVIIGSNYREKDEFGGAEINDVLYLIETINEIEKADTSAIGMFGWSRGGMMTYLALQKSDKIKTAIVGNGPSDLFGVISERPEMESQVISECVPNYWENKDVELKKRSVIYWTEELNKNSSLLLLCGTRDVHVNPQQARNLAEKLQQINFKFELKEFDTDHFFSDKKVELETLVIQWFNKELKKME